MVLLVGLLLTTACSGQSTGSSPDTPPVDPIVDATTTPSATTTSPATTSPPATTTTTTSTTTTATTSVAPPPIIPVEPLPDPEMTNASREFDALARTNPAVTMTVIRDSRVVLLRASGTTIDGVAATSDSPMVIASVGKLLTALMIARLDHVELVDVDAPTPWAEITTGSHPGWDEVTPRELLGHTSGMPVARPSWFDGELDCATFLPSLLDQPPSNTRGRWTYSNGNYCALGLLIERSTGLPLDEAAQALLLDPLGLTGIHLTTDGQLPGDVEYRPGIERLSRLGGAGAFIVSTDDIASVLSVATPADLGVLTWPGLIVDQYGWGHTGSIDGAVACAWVLEGGRTVVAATVAGRSPSTGGDVCDRVVPAVADDLGIGQGRPDRSPR